MKDIELHWEWPDDRTPTGTLQVQVKSIKRTSTGLFGFKKSPSYVYNYPDSMDLVGVVTSGDHHTRDKSLLLTMPLEYLKEIQVGDIVQLGLIDSACISLKK
ncbi:MAG: hypothetical protein QM715_10640 [Nibricoccus sp.]